MHFYQFHIGDYASHTRHLSLMEDLAYRRLLDFYYLHEQPIRQRDIARQIGMRDNEQDVLTVLNEFFLSTDAGFVNPRADAEITKFQEFAAAGKRGAAKRWAKATPEAGLEASPQAGVEASLKPPHKKANWEANIPPNPTPIATNNHKPIPKNQEEKTVATKVARPKSVDQQVWDDWLAIRRAKKLPLTKTAFEQIEAEAKAAGITIEVAIKECCLRGWAAFKVSWLKDNPITTTTQAFAGDI
jgi:uncharacterized protein YdaU (DUF1376 family)